MEQMPIENHFSEMKQLHEDTIDSIVGNEGSPYSRLPDTYLSQLMHLSNKGKSHAEAAEEHHNNGDYHNAHASLVAAAASFGHVERLLHEYRDQNHGLFDVKGGMGMRMYSRGKPWGEVLAGSYKQRMGL